VQQQQEEEEEEKKRRRTDTLFCVALTARTTERAEQEPPVF